MKDFTVEEIGMPRIKGLIPVCLEGVRRATWSETIHISISPVH